MTSNLSKHGLAGARWSVHEDITKDSSISACVDCRASQGTKPALKLRLQEEWQEEHKEQEKEEEEREGGDEDKGRKEVKNDSRIYEWDILT